MGERLRFAQEVAIPFKGAECLPWPYPKVTNGRGQIWIDGRHYYAHRYICEAVHGAPPTPDHEAAHSCGKGHEGCVNPNHLSWKTRPENIADQVIHGTSNRGERHGQAKLTEEDVREIRLLKDTASRAELAKRFGVDISNIGLIQRGQAWAWLD